MEKCGGDVRGVGSVGGGVGKCLSGGVGKCWGGVEKCVGVWGR